MKIKLKTLKELMEEYSFEVVKLNGTCIEKIEIKGRILTKGYTLDYLGEIIEVEKSKYIDINFILNNRGIHLWIPDWLVKELVEPKFKPITSFYEYYKLIGAGGKLYYNENGNKIMSSLNCYSSKNRILDCWAIHKYFERIEDEEK